MIKGSTFEDLINKYPANVKNVGGVFISIFKLLLDINVQDIYRRYVFTVHILFVLI